MKIELDFGNVLELEKMSSNAALIIMSISLEDGDTFGLNTVLTKAEAIKLADKLLELSK